jgi:ribosomal protein L19
MGAIETVEGAQITERPALRAGDTVRVHVKCARATKSASRFSRVS